MRQRRTDVEIDVIVFDGREYIRYPKSKRWADRNYYRSSGRSLHRDMWVSFHGSIPEGYHVHHKDGNPLNNTIDNLECLSSHDHQSNHEYTKSEEYKARRRENMDRQRPKTKEWHASPEGLAWHAKNGERAWKVRKEHSFKCGQCESLFVTKDTKAQYCSNNCKSAARRASGIDNETRSCVVCDTLFVVNRYEGTSCCSKSCAAKLRWTNKRKAIV